jgi:hypothetical protein
VGSVLRVCPGGQQAEHPIVFGDDVGVANISAYMGFVHHTDAEREWAYDRQSHIGKLDKALDEATAKGWTVVDMKKDWKRIYPYDK